MLKRLGSTLFWLVISAAFVGPGTVTVAAKAGASYDYALVWALVFSIVSVIILQEAAARIGLATGKSLGAVVMQRLKGASGRFLGLFMAAGVVLGCVAFEAGNITGALAGLDLLIGERPWWIIPLVGVLAAFLLSRKDLKIITSLLGILVVFMALGFLLVVINHPPELPPLLEGAFIPSFPDGAELLIISLIGTTVVPYNLFLGSGLAKGQGLKTMRWGLITSILIGGAVSVIILLAGRSIEGELKFGNMMQAMESGAGTYGRYLFLIGLFAAGFTSAVTAPLAAAMTWTSTVKPNEADLTSNRLYRGIWIGVLLVGLLLSALQFKPEVVIILAQAVNGFLVPLVAYYLWLMVNNRKTMGEQYLNPLWLNLLYFIIMWAVILVSLMNLAKLVVKLTGSEFDLAQLLPWEFALAGLITLGLGGLIRKERLR